MVAPYPQPQYHYGFVCPQISSATGAVRTAGLYLALTTSGIGERYAIYSVGNANEFPLAGNLGLGVEPECAPRIRDRHDDACPGTFRGDEQHVDLA
jgi:hypothetical protein